MNFKWISIISWVAHVTKHRQVRKQMKSIVDFCHIARGEKKAKEKGKKKKGGGKWKRGKVSLKCREEYTIDWTETEVNFI